MLREESKGVGLRSEEKLWTIRSFRELPSTNLKASELARGGAPEGTVVTARGQSSGRGRLGRRWFSPPGVGLYLSVILRPPLEPEQAARLSLVGGVAAAEAIERATSLSPSLKWPNDILIGRLKVGGLLSEGAGGGKRLDYLILGVGINVNTDTHQFPEELKGRACSLKMAAGWALDVGLLRDEFLHSLNHWYGIFLRGGLKELTPQWRRRSAIDGINLRVRWGDQNLEGLGRGIDEKGLLILESPDGELHSIASGEVEFL